MGNEPVAVGQAVTGFSAAALNFAVLINVWHATPEQLAGANVLVVAGVALVAAVLVRRRVTPTANK